MPKMETTKHSINLRVGDYEAIQSALKNKPFHASDVIRNLVSRYVDKVLKVETPDEILKNIELENLDD